jgi:hypothetical protein
MLTLEYTRSGGNTRAAALMQVATVTSESLSADNAAVYRLCFSQTTLHTLAARLIEQSRRSNADSVERTVSERGPRDIEELEIMLWCSRFSVAVDDGCGLRRYS